MFRIFKITLVIGVITGLGVPATAGTQTQAISAFEKHVLELTANAARDAQKVLKGTGTYQRTVGKSYVADPDNNWRIDTPEDPKDPITISNKVGMFAIRIRHEDSFIKSFSMTTGPLTYLFQGGHFTSPIIKQDGSLQIVSEIQNPQASSNLIYEFNLPHSMRLVSDIDSGLILIVDAAGAMVGGIAPAWAIDADGKQVKSWYELHGNTVSQKIDTTMSGITYPIIADPWLGFDLISNSTWAATLNPPDKYAPTLNVYPSEWGRVVAAATTFPLGDLTKIALDSMAVRAGWDETLAKTAKSATRNPNTQSMYHQFECHFFYVSKRAPNKVSWNLDLKRRDANFVDQALNNCNMP
jgi:hypothetical protein